MRAFITFPLGFRKTEVNLYPDIEKHEGLEGSCKWVQFLPDILNFHVQVGDKLNRNQGGVEEGITGPLVGPKKSEQLYHYS